jgi:geranyl-CoA carboxylase alpha subunit
MNKLLIANRGEIARRIIRTAHRMGLSTVAVCSDADRGALHVREATTAVALGGTASADSYLRVDKLIAAARDSGADAVHPGYGFLSENADFAQAVIDAGLTWVGPPPAAIQALGSKSAAKALALRQGVPVLPGYFGADQSDAVFAAEAQRIGFPLMVKAVAGGGGRGMRLVHSAEQLPAALQSARSEALAGFGHGDLLIERALLNPRHVEVQVFADAHGHCIHLGERDCSVQRRHQKIIEESPSPAVPPELRAELGRCAVALAQGAAYVGAGTVEFLLDGHLFYLMEMNTRLQVEHPVTEMLTGLDLVEWQLRVACGEPLPLTQDKVQLSGHAIEVRLCAEDAHFRPHTGRVLHFAEPPHRDGLRFDHALETGTEVSPHYDALLGKLIAHAPTRAEAIQQLAQALDATQVLGLATNRAFLAACLRHPQFRTGEATIPFLAEQGDTLRAGLQATPTADRVAALAITFATQRPAPALPPPFVRSLSLCDPQLAPARTWAARLRETGQGAVELEVEGQTHAASVAADADGQRRITLDGQAWRARVQPLARPGHWQVQLSGPEGSFELQREDRSFAPRERAGGAAAARELRAPFNGKLVAVHAMPGQAVQRGAPLLVIESMKLEHTLAAPRDAVVDSVAVAVGQQLAPGQLLMNFMAETAEARAAA